MSRYQELASKMRADGDAGACTVIATAIVCGCSWRTAERINAEYGRQKRQGTFFNGTTLMHNVLARLGKVAQPEYNVRTNPGTPRFTLKTVARRYPKGRYLVFVHGHVLALRNGVIDDFSDGRQHKVLSVYKIEGKQS